VGDVVDLRGRMRPPGPPPPPPPTDGRRLARIRASLERIERLMAELRILAKEYDV
jgi:hypothetical protein